ncbi:glutamate racemase [Maribacter halichondriae]|uniref:glutamate racemase n=1 Tax=Maribacter halichondriae TaxID=2980554 RepID=UPI00235A3024|nr:glutamate racemase [Maribacter sp. Hal144]
MKADPIGIFDSGVGGTSIWKEIQALMPKESTLYLADSANAPYGEKSKNEIVRLSIKNTEFLLDQGCKLIVVACNTATTNAIDYLRENYDVPFIGIEPAIKPAALQSKSKTVGVLATKGTLSSSLFHSTSENHANGITIIEREGSGLVELIEAGKIDSPEMHELLKKFLAPMLAEGIDYLVLGCTHYPYLIPMLEKMLPDHVMIIDSGEAVARQTKSILEQRDLLNESNKKGTAIFRTNGNLTVLENFLKDSDVAEVSYLDF